MNTLMTLAAHDPGYNGPGPWWPIFPIFWLLAFIAFAIFFATCAAAAGTTAARRPAGAGSPIASPRARSTRTSTAAGWPSSTRTAGADADDLGAC